MSLAECPVFPEQQTDLAACVHGSNLTPRRGHQDTTNLATHHILHTHNQPDRKLAELLYRNSSDRYCRALHVTMWSDFRWPAVFLYKKCLETLSCDIGSQIFKENMGLALNHWTILSHSNDYYSKTKTAQQSQTELLLCLLDV